MRTNLALSWLAVLLVTGCVLPGHDPIVVNAERSVKAAFQTIQVFLRYEESHRTELKVFASDVTGAADQIRAQAPQAFRDAWKLIDVYRANRTPENRATLKTALAIVDRLLAIAEEHLKRMEKIL